MNECYMEQLVPRKAAVKKDCMIKYSCLLLTVGMVAMTFLFGLLFLIPSSILLGIDIYLIKNSNVEYEYLYLNGELDIDKIIAKQKRKSVYSVSASDIVVVAPLTSAEVRPFQSVKVHDYSSGVMSVAVYKMIISKNGEKEAILFEPNDKLLQGIKMYAPRKVFI